MLRVTQGMMNHQLLRNVNRNMVSNNILQNQLSTGLRINKPSDDPVGIVYGLRYRSELSATEQYAKNVDSSISWLEFNDTTVGQLGSVIHKIRELAVKAANGSNPDTAMDAINREVKELYNQLVTIGNTTFNGKYVFNGQMIETAPYAQTTLDEVNSGGVMAWENQTDSGKAAQMMFELGEGLRFPINITGDELFGAPNSSENVFKLVGELSDAIAANDNEAVGDMLDRIDLLMDKTLEIRSEIGARTNRLELIQNRLEDAGLNLESMQSKVEDADMVEVITRLKMGENIYQASLSVGARLISPSLVDFLR